MVISMRNATKTFIEIYKGMSTVSKYIMGYGTAVIATLIVCALYFYIQSLSSGMSFYNIIMAEEIMVCIKECMGSVYILPMLYELLFLIRKNS